ncbi:glutamate ligase domain-containing protein [Kaarinaea lacus]
MRPPLETIRLLSKSTDLDLTKKRDTLGTTPRTLMENIDIGQPYQVLVYCAQTPDALENTLTTLKTIALEREGRLLLLFGCSGNRNREIRAKMGEIASKIADFVVITDDNPCSEYTWGIIEDILQGFNQLMKKFSDYIVIQDRKKAIQYIIKHAKQNDIVILAGKGHEPFQILKSETIPIKDREEAINAITNRRSPDLISTS